MIYMIQRGKQVKIGYSVDPRGRLRQLQTGNPERLSLLGVKGGDLAEERYWHNHLKRYRIGSSEWFEFSDEIKAIAEARFSPWISARRRRHIEDFAMHPRGHPDRCHFFNSALMGKYKEWCALKGLESETLHIFAFWMPQEYSMETPGGNFCFMSPDQLAA
jgi:hypothetical protein